MIDFKTFPRQLARWAVHVSACALPSFFIALIIGFKSPSAIAGMLCGIATFIIVYALFTSTHFYLRRRDSLLGQSLRAGTKVRVLISLCSLPLLVGFFVPSEFLIRIIPDFWCGFLAATILDHLNIVIGSPVNPREFLSSYLLTVTEGLIISVTLAILCLLALWPISMRVSPNPGSGLS